MNQKRALIAALETDQKKDEEALRFHQREAERLLLNITERATALRLFKREEGMEAEEAPPARNALAELQGGGGASYGRPTSLSVAQAVQSIPHHVAFTASQVADQLLRMHRPSVSRGALSMTLTRMAERGDIRLVERGEGSKPSLYARVVRPSTGTRVEQDDSEDLPP